MVGSLSAFSQDRLREARIVVAGCGALGNEVLKNLALAGAGHITIVDFDEVEPSNLNRSVLFRREDAAGGRLKVDAAAGRLKELNPDICITTVCGDVAYDVGLGVFREADVVIGCVDSRWARYCINRLCMRAGTPWVDGGIDGLEGTARVFVPGRNCYACNLGPQGLDELRRRVSCAGVIRRQEEAGHVPTTGVAASVIGAVQVQEAMKLLHPEALEDGSLGSLAGRIFYYDGRHLTTRTAEFEAYDDDCPLHERWEPVGKIGLDIESTVEAALEGLAVATGTRDVAFWLHDDCFVDVVGEKDGDLSWDVMLPGRKVAPFVEAHPEMRSYPYSALWQNEFSSVDAAFPYRTMTLGELGIPPRDVLKVRAAGRTMYFEIG